MPRLKARYEYKYLLTEEQADVVREFLDVYMERDPMSGDTGRYDVTSVYLDTWDWYCAQITVEGLRTRFKLRARCYTFDEPTPVFLENKMRVGTSIVKQRSMVPRDQAESILAGEMPPPGGWTACKASHQDDLIRFADLMDKMDLRPRVWVRYSREPWVSPWGEGSRVTFDRDLEVQLADPDSVYRPDTENWTRVPLSPQTILELKFNGAFPHWMQRLVHYLQLRRLSCSKYVLGTILTCEQPWAGIERNTQWIPF